MKRSLIIEIICFLYVLLFLYAAGVKLVEHDRFISQIGLSPLVSDYAELLAWLVPITEFLAAAMLIIPKFRLIGLYISFTLMVLFTFYISAILTISTDLPCSCGGVLNTLGWQEHLVFNIGYVILGGAGILLMKKQEQMDSGEMDKRVMA